MSQKCRKPPTRSLKMSGILYSTRLCHGGCEEEEQSRLDVSQHLNHTKKINHFNMKINGEKKEFITYLTVNYINSFLDEEFKNIFLNTEAYSQPNPLKTQFFGGILFFKVLN